MNGLAPRHRLCQTYRQRWLEHHHAQTWWETGVASGVTLADLDRDQIRQIVGAAVQNGRLADPEPRELLPLLRGVNLLDGLDRLPDAGAVMFGKSPAFQREYPQSRLRMARFRGGNKAEFVDNRQVVGTILVLYQRAQEFLLDHIQIAGKVEEGQFERTDVPGYPLDALREALANAFCHRDYTEGGGAVDLAVYDDRIEIVSSGTLHFGLTVESLLTEHQSRPWNPVIADVLFKRGVIESWGRGTLKMVESTRQVGLVNPEFEASPHSFTVRFRSREYMPPTRVSHDLTPLHRRILACLQTLGPSNGSEVGAALGEEIEYKTLLRNLHALSDFGLIEKSGVRRGTKWFLARRDAGEGP